MIFQYLDEVYMKSSVVLLEGGLIRRWSY